MGKKLSTLLLPGCGSQLGVGSVAQTITFHWLQSTTSCGQMLEVVTTSLILSSPLSLGCSNRWLPVRPVSYIGMSGIRPINRMWLMDICLFIFWSSCQFLYSFCEIS